MVILGPKSAASAGGGAARASFALISGSAADFFNKESADTARRVISSHASQPAIYHMPDAVDCDRGFRDIRRDHHFSKFARCKSTVLIFGWKFAMQRN